MMGQHSAIAKTFICQRHGMGPNWQDGSLEK